MMVRDLHRGAAATAARPGEEVDVPFSADDDASKEIEISAAAATRSRASASAVRAGQRLKHVVKLRTGSN